MTRLGVHLGPRRRSKLVNDSERIASFTSLLLPVPSKGVFECRVCLLFSSGAVKFLDAVTHV
jgi:hypothetical protein